MSAVRSGAELFFSPRGDEHGSGLCMANEHFTISKLAER